MSRRLALVLAPLLLGMACPWGQAQSTSTSDLIPKRTSLARLGLERQWLIVVPVAGSERVVRISRSSDLFFVQTNEAMLHVYEVESGRHLWSARIGEQASYARPISSNSFAVFATCSNLMLALDRNTGRTIWKSDLTTIPTSGTACDENYILVGLNTGMINCYSLKEEKQKDGTEKIRDKPSLAWRLKTAGRVRTLPLIAENIVCMGSDDGRVFVNMLADPTPLYRFKTGGPVGEELGTYGTRSLLVPSEDYNLYSIDVLTAKMLWTFPSGAPIMQAPMIVGEDVFVINTAGNLSVLDPKSGAPRWTLPTHSARLLGASRSKVYLRTIDLDLLIVDRATGKVIADPAATLERAGLNLRELDLNFRNRFDDRLYLGSSSGLVVSFREIGETKPFPLREPGAVPFAHVPPEGIVEQRPAPPPADAEPGAEPVDPNAPAAPEPE